MRLAREKRVHEINEMRLKMEILRKFQKGFTLTELHKEGEEYDREVRRLFNSPQGSSPLERVVSTHINLSK